MSDWDFLHDMHNEGYSSEQIADAAACGYNPWEVSFIDIDREWVDSQFPAPEKDQPKETFKSRDGFPYSTLEQAEIFHDLIECATRHFENTGRYLQIWGELGEIYAEIKFGLCRHGSHKEGSDGTIAGKLVEVKTISPEKITIMSLLRVKEILSNCSSFALMRSFSSPASYLIVASSKAVQVNSSEGNSRMVPAMPNNSLRDFPSTGFRMPAARPVLFCFSGTIRTAVFVLTTATRLSSL